MLDLRNHLMNAILSFKDELSREDIVAHTLLNEDEQIFFRNGYQERVNSPIIITGNELVKQQIADFSTRLDLKELYSYYQ